MTLKVVSRGGGGREEANDSGKELVIGSRKTGVPAEMNLIFTVHSNSVWFVQCSCRGLLKCLVSPQIIKHNQFQIKLPLGAGKSLPCYVGFGCEKEL